MNIISEEGVDLMIWQLRNYPLLFPIQIVLLLFIKPFISDGHDVTEVLGHLCMWSILEGQCYHGNDDRVLLS